MKLFYPMCIVLSLVACGGDANRYSASAESTDFEPDERPIATTLVYTCNDYEFVARLGPGEMALWLPERYVILSQVGSASGTLYEEEEVSFWSRGEEAMLTVGEQHYKNCHLRPDRVAWEDARRRGVDFRGVGSDPGWSLENGDGSMSVYAGATETQDLRVEIVDVPCVDAVSGNIFPSEVVVTFTGTGYHGCGQDLYYPWTD
jgi:membrane-bound inhibitor of C-type lysozyme